MIRSRRAADALEGALALLDDDRALARLAAGTRELAEVARAVRGLTSSAAGPLGPTDEFREQLRLRVMAEAEGLAAVRAARARAARPASGRRGPGPARVFTFGRGKRLVAATAGALLVGGSAVAVVSSTALPGELLYPVKRGIEQVRVATSLSDSARGDAQLALARERLDEAEQLATRDGVTGAAAGLDADTVERIGAGLRDFETSATEGTRLLLDDYAERGDAASLATVDTFLREVVPRLERLRPELPANLARHVDDLLDRLDSTGRELDATAAACGATCTSLGIGGAGLSAGGPAGGYAAARSAGAQVQPVPVTPAPATSTPGAGLQVPPVAVQDGAGADSGLGLGAGLPAVGAGGSGVSADLPRPTVAVGSTTLALPGVGVELPVTSSSTTTSSSSSSTTTTPPDGTCLHLVVTLCVD